MNCSEEESLICIVTSEHILKNAWCMSNTKINKTKNADVYVVYIYIFVFCFNLRHLRGVSLQGTCKMLRVFRLKIPFFLDDQLVSLH